MSIRELGTRRLQGRVDRRPAPPGRGAPLGRYTVAEVRRSLARALDEAGRGETVIIERRGQRFRVQRETTGSRPDVPRKVQVLDPAILDGEWGWEWGGRGSLTFVPERGSRR